MSFRFLIFYINQNSGHFKAAQAIEETVNLHFDNIQVKTLDGFNYINPVLSKIIYNSYLSLIKNKPEVWEYLYDNPNLVKKVQKFKELVHKYNSPKLDLLIKKYRPHAIICTQAFPCGLVAGYKSVYCTDIPLIAVLTDYYPHSFWLYSQVDIYNVACDEAKQRLFKEGISKDKIRVNGIPVSPLFFKNNNSNDLYSKYNLDSGLSTILIMGGSHGVGPFKKIVYSIDSIDLDFQVVIVTGLNSKLNKYLNKKKKRFSHKFIIYSYTKGIHELMQISDVLITKPGGLTTAEAISKELPMIIFNPIPGQEKNNTDYLTHRGMALKANNPQDICILTKEILTNKTKYLQMKKEIRQNKFDNPALKIVKTINPRSN